MRRLLLAALALSLVPAAAGCGALGLGGGDADLQVYSARHYDLERAFARFEDETGISVDFIYGDNAELLERLKAEGEDSPADLFMTVDAGNLWAASEAGVLQPVESAVLHEAIPARYRDPDDRWVGLALRARTVAYNPARVDPAELDATNTYAGLADPRWSGRLCMRDATEAYTQSLVAALIDAYGAGRTREIVDGWLANDVDIMSNDILLLEAVAAGTCDVALVNHYYYARELAAKPDLDVRLFWASQEGEGTQMNISGGGVVATTDNEPDARRLLEWLATDGQDAFIAGQHELPANPDVAPDQLVASFGDFKQMPVDAAAYGRLNAQALDLLLQAGYE